MTTRVRTRIIKNDEWVDRKYVLDNYPISDRTYNKKVKMLDNDTKYQEYVFVGKNNKRFIHKTVLNEIFLTSRLPNYNCPDKIRKWVRLHKWNYFGNITPKDCDKNCNKSIINEFHSILKRQYSDLVTYYSIEPNPESNSLSHTHFLLKTEYNIDKNMIVSQVKDFPLINEFLFPNDNRITNDRLDIRRYDYDRFGELGLNYVMKYGAGALIN